MLAVVLLLVHCCTGRRLFSADDDEPQTDAEPVFQFECFKNHSTLEPDSDNSPVFALFPGSGDGYCQVDKAWFQSVSAKTKTDIISKVTGENGKVEFCDVYTLEKALRCAAQCAQHKSCDWFLPNESELEVMAELGLKQALAALSAIVRHGVDYHKVSRHFVASASYSSFLYPFMQFYLAPISDTNNALHKILWKCPSEGVALVLDSDWANQLSLKPKTLASVSPAMRMCTGFVADVFEVLKLRTEFERSEQTCDGPFGDRIKALMTEYHKSHGFFEDKIVTSVFGDGLRRDYYRVDLLVEIVTCLNIDFNLQLVGKTLGTLTLADALKIDANHSDVHRATHTEAVIRQCEMRGVYCFPHASIFEAVEDTAVQKLLAKLSYWQLQHVFQMLADRFDDDSWQRFAASTVKLPIFVVRQLRDFLLANGKGAIWRGARELLPQGLELVI